MASAVDASCVLAIDTMASDTPEHIGSTIQITDTGLKIIWSKEEINHSTVGLPVIGIGVPTMIRTKALNINIPCDNYITVSNIKSVIKNAALIVAYAIMRISYPGLDSGYGGMIATEISLL